MRSKSKLISNLFILFFFEILEMKADNNINGGCKDNYLTLLYKRGNENKIKNFKKDNKLIKEKKFLCQ